MAAIAPMDLAARNQPTSIPLRCNLCPKKPNFSDLSHLLTHISSKSHLAHRFKVELKARTDRQAYEDVREYDEWCERYGINALLADRMAAKEQKKNPNSKRVRGANQTQRGSLDASSSRQSSVKHDPEDNAATWGYAPGHSMNAGQGYGNVPGFHSQGIKRTRSDCSNPSTPRQGQYRRWPSETETTDSVIVSEEVSETNDFPEDELDSSKLKGVRYPGMGLFDSADETQRRMRNQRKDDSVLKQMEQSSAVIEPNEFVWNEDGEFQRVRDIYASPSIEGSPDRKFEEDDNRKRKKVRVSAHAQAAEASRQRQSTTRITRQTAARYKNGGDGLLLDEDDESRNSAHGHSTIETLDIFRDSPNPNPGPADGAFRDTGFELRRRPALQNLDSNNMISQKTSKPHGYFHGRDNTAAFAQQRQLANGHFFQHQHGMGGGTFNPLCQNRPPISSGFHYLGYVNINDLPPFLSETKASTPNFQMGSMGINSMGYNAFTSSYATDQAHDRVDQEFDL